jgi:hypothetical protein
MSSSGFAATATYDKDLRLELALSVKLVIMATLLLSPLVHPHGRI